MDEPAILGMPEGVLFLLIVTMAFAAAAVLIWRRQRFAGIVVGIGVPLLAAIQLPSLRPAKSIAYRNACITNLEQIQDAKAQWAAKNKKSSNDIPADTDLFGEGAYLRQKPECPSGGSYQLGAVGQKASCSEVAKGHRLK